MGLQGELYDTYGSLGREGGQLERDNFQAVHGLIELGGGGGRGPVLGDTAALVLGTCLYS